MDKRRMCPHCRAFVTTSDKVCPYCDAAIGPRAIDVRKPDDIAGGLIPHARFVTMLLMVVNSGLFAATVIYSMNRGNSGAVTNVDPLTLVLFGGKFTRLIFGNGEYWRLVTAGFLHAGIIHFGMNSWVLYDLGANVEEAFGSARMIAIYFVSTVLGFLASSWWSQAPSVGASAGLFGLIGAMIAYGMQHQTLMGQMIKTHYSRWAMYGLIIGLLGFLPIDNAAHIGGLAGGFGVAWLAGVPMSAHPRELTWTYISYLCVGLTLVSFVMAGLRFVAATSGG
ncbi:MAG: rhomboid family intramembrane serine protease [Bryobacteraceae bacterium]